MAELRPWVAKPRGAIRIYDGDTFYSERLDCGWGVSANKPKFRIARIDTPEKGWRAKSEREKALAIEATAMLQKLFDEADDILVYSELGRGKFGRLLVEVICVKDDVQTNAGDALIEAGLARRYDGGTKSSEPW